MGTERPIQLSPSAQLHRDLADEFRKAQLLRAMRISRYDAGKELTFEATGVVPARNGHVRLVVEEFVGGGFAGQVYRVRLLAIEAPGGPLAGLEAGGTYAMKILIPPSGRARLFRDGLYRAGFQGPFQLQANPAAARTGALWQSFIRRAAAARFGDDRCVVDIHATFVDERLGSCGELSEWIDGRVWRFEVDNRLDALARWRHRRGVDPSGLGSPEYRAKYEFMRNFVRLLHEMGAHELARQYEWATCKSQPNVLKRRHAGDDPAAGLTAVDFRAGLALLPVLPMSPGDFKLIGAGLARGSLVQFDRGDLGKLRAFINAHPDQFAGMHEALDELTQAESLYRDSVPDITHNHVRLLYSRKLWSTMLDSAVTGWRVRNIADEACADRLGRSRLATLAFLLVGMLGALSTAAAIAWGIVALTAGTLTWPLVGALAGLAVGGIVLGRRLRIIWGRADYRKHYAALIASPSYFARAVRGRMLEKLIAWHRSGRLSEAGARLLAARPWRFWLHLPLSILPASVHRLLTDGQYLREKLSYVFVRPVMLYFSAKAREKWLRDMLAAGRENGMLSKEDAKQIDSQLAEPFIQKYLRSLAVHVCTLPITQIVSVTIAAVWVWTHPGRPNAWAEGAAIIGAFQVTPISPGSIVRGLYVLMLVIRERNFKDYNIAVFMSFFKYIGYLAFPIQMAYRYPALARFMAGHWATGAVHFVPVFGERGALLEHAVFNCFYNHPLTIRRQMRARAKQREKLPERRWHVPLVALLAVAVFVLADLLWLGVRGRRLTLRSIWPLTLMVPVLGGAAVTVWARGAVLIRRIACALICGLVIGLGVWIRSLVGRDIAVEDLFGHFARDGSWRMFVFGLLTVLGAIVTEVMLPEPRRPHKL